MKLDAFVVTAIVVGAVRALNQQRTAANLQNIVSADAIGRFPDPNIAEALQRVVGIGVERGPTRSASAIRASGAT